MISRRFLAGTLALFALTGLTAQADTVEIPNRSSFSSGQTDPAWGWATCNQILLNSTGVPDTAEDQVEKLFGEKMSKDVAPGFEEEAKALKGEYTNTTGGETDIFPAILDASKGPIDYGLIIASLKADRPVVVATKTHRWVCYGATYTQDGGKTQLTVLKLIDPANGTDSKVPLYQEKSLDDLTKDGLVGFLTFKTEA